MEAARLNPRPRPRPNCPPAASKVASSRPSLIALPERSHLLHCLTVACCCIGRRNPNNVKNGTSGRRAVLGRCFFFAFRDYIDRVGFHVICRITVLCVCCLVALPVSGEDELWEWVTPTPQGHDLFAAEAGNGVTVAVGRNGTVITSTDGIEWWTRQTGTEYGLRDVAWANGLFVAVGGESGEEFSPGLGVILTSDDGISWIERYRENSLTLNAVVWTGTRFIAVGNGYGALLSSDGLNWSKVELGGSQFIWDLAWNGSLLVAIGRRGYFGGTPTFFTSEDGEVWQQATIERTYAPDTIAASGSRFVAVGSERDALVSDDGLTWTEAPYDAPRGLEEIGEGENGFVATGWGIVGTSPDGYSWLTKDQYTETLRINGLAWGGDAYLGVGEDGFMMSSPDGWDWTQISERSFDVGESIQINELAMDGSTIVGVGETGVIITGKHGTEWVQRDSAAGSELNAVLWTGSAFWTVGRDRVMSSVDGVHWAEMHFDPDINLFDIAWNGSLFVAVGWNSTHGDGRKLVLTSSNGINWSYLWVEREEHLFTVGWTGSRFVVAGGGTNYLTSSDGVVWDLKTWDEDLELTDMAWNGARLVAVGGRWGVGGFIRSTEDGVQWLESALPEDDVSSFDDVTWTGTHFVAVSRSSGDVIFTSTDGISWSSETTGTGVWPVSVVGDDRSLFRHGPGSPDHPPHEPSCRPCTPPPVRPESLAGW